MSVLFFVPMVFIALHESLLDPRKNKWMNNWVNGSFEADDSAQARDPEVDGVDADRGMKICTVPFEEIVKSFPNTQQVTYPIFDYSPILIIFFAVERKHNFEGTRCVEEEAGCTDKVVGIARLMAPRIILDVYWTLRL